MIQLSNLPVSERLALVQELWDSIARSKAEMPIQDWHREIVNARQADFDGRETELGLTRENVWEQRWSSVERTDSNPFASLLNSESIQYRSSSSPGPLVCSDVT